MSTSTTALVTAEQLLTLPDEGERHELVRGELRSRPLMGFHDGRTAARIAAALHRHVEERGLGAVVTAGTGFWIEDSPDTVRAPDAAFVAAHRLPPTTSSRASSTSRPTSWWRC